MSARTYHGSCHCGAIRFSFSTSEDILSGCRCNCSICRRKGAVMSDRYFPPESVKLEVHGELGRYQFADHDVNHYFCKRCGIYPFHDAKSNPGHYRINLGCVEEVDPLALEIRLIDGRSF
jgi:hypothetical protein